MSYSTSEDSSFESCGNEYVPSPKHPIKGRVSSIVLPNAMCLIELSQLYKFIEQVNCCRGCKTPGCAGNLVPVHVNSVGNGGGLVIKYACNDCASSGCVLETFSQYKEGGIPLVVVCR